MTTSFVVASNSIVIFEVIFFPAIILQTAETVSSLKLLLYINSGTNGGSRKNLSFEDLPLHMPTHLSLRFTAAGFTLPVSELRSTFHAGPLRPTVST